MATTRKNAQPKRTNTAHAPGALPGTMLINGSQNPDQPLTEKQRAFVTNFVEHKLNQSAAARQAGFAQPNQVANQLMKNPKIRAAIAEARAEFALASGMTKRKVIEGFSEAIDMARIKADPLVMVSGWREIGKMCGFYEPTKTEIKVSVQGQVLLHRLNTMTDAELLQLSVEDPTALEGDFSVVDDE